MTTIQSKTLHLTLKKKWFDMILSGEKKEEYREIKPYWIKRLIAPEFAWNSLTKEDRESHLYACPNGFYNHFDTITFKNGYAGNAPEMIIELKSIKIHYGVPDWGASVGIEYFVLELGDIISTKNIKQ